MASGPRCLDVQLGDEGGEQAPFGTQVAEVLTRPHRTVARCHRGHGCQCVFEKARSQFRVTGLDGDAHGVHAIGEFGEEITGFRHAAHAVGVVDPSQRPQGSEIALAQNVVVGVHDVTLVLKPQHGRQSELVVLGNHALHRATRRLFEQEAVVIMQVGNNSLGGTAPRQCYARIFIRNGEGVGVPVGGGCEGSVEDAIGRVESVNDRAKRHLARPVELFRPHHLSAKAEVEVRHLELNHGYGTHADSSGSTAAGRERPTCSYT